MKIIDQSHEIINLPETILGIIEQCARTCYKSEDKIGCTVDGVTEGKGTLHSPCWHYQAHPKSGCQKSSCEYHSSQKFVQMLLDRGHDAMLEFGDITVRFTTNRGVTHELVRHRLFSYAQESTRYVKYDREMEFIRPVWWEDSTAQQQMLWRDAMNYAASYYAGLLHIGWRAEQAREILPNSLKTEIVVKGNIRSFRHLFQLRTSKKAHPQIRGLLLPLLSELKEKIPVVFDDIRE